MEGSRVRVFFDASVLNAASASPEGGSSLAVNVCQRDRFKGVVTERVLQEGRKNLSKKFGEEELLRFYRLLAALSPDMQPPPSEDRIEECAALVGPKDAHVLAAALESHAGYLLTFDRRHLLTPLVLSADLPLKVMTPGDFLREVAAVPEE